LIPGPPPISVAPPNEQRWQQQQEQPQSQEQLEPGVCFFFKKLDKDGNKKFQDCLNVNPRFCSLCQKNLCDVCRNDFERRWKAWLEECKRKVLDAVAKAFR